MTKLQEIEEIIERLPLEHKISINVYFKHACEAEDAHSKNMILCSLNGYVSALHMEGHISLEDEMKFWKLRYEDFMEVA